jgi:hypothetical protein
MTGLGQTPEDLNRAVTSAARYGQLMAGCQTGRVSFASPPPAACWQHQGLRSGFEVAYFTVEASGVGVDGATTGLQDRDTWIVTYNLQLDESWCTRRARVTTRTVSGVAERVLESDGGGHWVVDGELATELDGCLDVDLESSAMTNALPVHRLRLAVGEQAAAPAAYVRVLNMEVERLEQGYARVDDQESLQQYDYEAPVFDFRCRLVYDASGLVLEYPGIAVRSA